MVTESYLSSQIPKTSFQSVALHTSSDRLQQVNSVSEEKRVNFFFLMLVSVFVNKYLDLS